MRQARTTLAFKLLNYTKKRYPFISLLLLSPLRDRNDEVVYLIGTTQPRFLDPDSPELQPAPSHGPEVGHVLDHPVAADGGVEHSCAPLSPTLPPPRLKDARASELLPAATAAAAAAAAATAAATVAAAEAATAAPQPPAVPTPPRPAPTASAHSALEPDARPPQAQAPPLQADLDLVELLPPGELDEIATLMQLQPWRVSPPRQRAAGPASSANSIHAALTAAIYDREAEACAAAAQATQAAAAAEPASQRSSVPPSASYDATESQLRLESAAALRAAWLYGLCPVESSAAMQTATALLPLQHSPSHLMARNDHPAGDGGGSGSGGGGHPSVGASQPAAAAACGGAARLGHGAGAAFGGGGGGGDSVAFGNGGESTAAAAAAVAAACGAHGDASAAFGGGAAALPAATAMATATWFAQAQMPTPAQMQLPMQALMQMPAQPQMQMPQQMPTQRLSPRPSQPSVISLLDEIQRGSVALAHVQRGVSGTFGGASACSFGPGGGGCDPVSSVGHSVLHGGGIGIATAALAPRNDWLCSSPVAAASGAQGSGAAVGGGSCLSPGGAAASGSAGGAGGARAGAMLVQQRYRECEQMLGLLEVAVLQLDTRYRCGAALRPPSPPHPRVPYLRCSLGLTIEFIGLAHRQAKVSLSTSVEGLAGYLEAQPESAELVLQARRVGLLR